MIKFYSLLSKGRTYFCNLRAVIKNNIGGSAMLHLEVYKGTETGPLTQRNNKEFDYVPNKNYQRRSDLIDPTGAKDLRVIN